MSCCGGPTAPTGASSPPPDPPVPPNPPPNDPPTLPTSSSSPPPNDPPPLPTSSSNPPPPVETKSSPIVQTKSSPIPLSLSSVALLDDDKQTPGFLMGLYAIVHHALLACASMTPTLVTDGSGDWEAKPVMDQDDIEPQSLRTKLGFDHAYVRHCLIYNGAALLEKQELIAFETWQVNPMILGCISLYYASQDMMEDDELKVSYDDMGGELPATILYRATVEYKNVRASSGNVQARQAEELSMLTFGASVDDDVKLGALSSIYDPVGKYRLEVDSLRKKTYSFDVMDTVISDGTVPSLMGGRALSVKSSTSSSVDNDDDAKQEDTFGKTFGVTVVDHSSEAAPQPAGATPNMTRLTLALEGSLRPRALEIIEDFHSIPRKLQRVFPVIGNPSSVVASQCQQALLVDKEEASRIYINGRFVIEWGKDKRIATDAPALFGMDISHSVPVWHGRIMDYDSLKMEYATMWQELLIDARQTEWNLASRLLSRLVHGRDPDDLDESDDSRENENGTDVDCLESQVMSSPKYDPVGICAKALATRFSLEYGKSAFPCLEHEVDWVRARLGHKTPVVVPQRALNILRRGGYFDVHRTTQDLWFASTPASKQAKESELVEEAVAVLKASGCGDIVASRVVFIDMEDQLGAIQDKLMCRYDATTKQYYVNRRQVMEMNKPALALGMYLAQEHPDGTVLYQYITHTASEG